jgi:integrase
MRNDRSTVKRTRHVPVRGANRVYVSQRSGGEKVYEVRHPTNAEGKRLYEVVGPSLDEAKARAYQIHCPSAPRVLSVGTTFAQVVENWRLTRVMRPRSARDFDAILERRILPTFGRIKVRDIDKAAIVSWLNGLTRLDGSTAPLAGSTRRLTLATLMLVLRHAMEIGAIGILPELDKRNRPKQSEPRRRIVSYDEEARLLALSAPFPWLRPTIVVALHEALRLGEVAGVQWDDVDFTRKTLTVRHSLSKDRMLGPSKGGKACTIPLTPAARAALLELRHDSDGKGFVFRNDLGGPRQICVIQHAFAKTVRRAALTETADGRVCFHSLRHTGISRLANHPGIPLVHVRDFARHADLATTQGYVHRIEDERVTRAIGEALAGAAISA